MAMAPLPILVLLRLAAILEVHVLPVSIVLPLVVIDHFIVIPIMIIVILGVVIADASFAACRQHDPDKSSRNPNRAKGPVDFAHVVRHPIWAGLPTHES